MSDQGNEVFTPIDPKGQWGLVHVDGTFVRLGRADSKFFDVVSRDMGGYHQPVVHEEPAVQQGADGLRVVGTIDILYRSTGDVIVRDTACVDGTKTIELLPSSVSKGDLPTGSVLDGHLKINPKRIAGDVKVHLRQVGSDHELADGQRWMSVKDFLRDSHDNRGKGAVAHAMARDASFAKACFLSFLS